MKPSFHELVDINELHSLCEIFSKLTGFVTAILDMEGNVLVATGWQEICTEFHRKNPETAEACRKSDTVLGELPSPGAKYRVYRCNNGLIDVSVPIMVENLQIGRLYTGQFLFAPPDMELFRHQAAQYGFHETSYLEAVQKVPIVTEEQVGQAMEFLCRLAEMIGRMGLGNLRLREANEELRKNRQELERRVDERTAELSAKNEQLQGEIAERKHAEEALLRLNRELMAISRCHEVLIRATDEETLLRDICRIICDEAGYRMAWVGYAEHDEAKSVRPVLWAGFEEGYLAEASITWADTERGRGPTGKAIRSGECVCIQDFTAAPQAAPWREGALQRGYRSSIALPLKDETSSTFGVINIYSTEPDTFTPDEMRLLGKLADDLSFGISTLRTRAERNRSSRDLQKSNELLRAIIDAAPTAIIGLDLDGRVQTVWNQAAEKMLGWSVREAMGNFLPSVPLDKEEEFQRFRETIRSGKTLNGIEVRRQRRDGTPVDYSIYASPLHDLDGRIIGNIAVLVDITERKRVDELLRENLIRLQTMVRNAPIILYGVDRKGVFTLSEGKGLAGMGLNPGEIVGLSAFDVYRDYPDCLENFRRALAGEAFKAPVHFGDHLYDAYHEPVFGDDGAYAGTFGVVVDVTERTQAEEALRQASLVVENSPVVLFRWRAAEGWPVEMVSKNVTQFGYTPEEFLSGALPFASIIHPQDLERVASEVSGYSEQDAERFEQDYRIITRDGEVRWVYDRTVIERDREGSITHYQGIVIDITDRKLAEKALRESTDRLQSIFRVAPVGIGVVRDRVLLEVNRRLTEITGYSQEELVGRSARILYPDQEEFERVGRDKYHQIGEQATGVVETRWLRKDGSIIDVFLSSTPLEPPDLSKGVIFTALDITERKHALENIRAALLEKEVLLKEIHHRVKNNLQIITTLLDLQSDSIDDKQAVRAFRESQDRIRAMAMVHEQLYQSRDLAHIDFGEYIENLAVFLFNSYMEYSERITLKVDVGQILLEIDSAIPCGLIVNELVSNALKHAFPDARQGEISIRLHTGDDGMIRLTVADNGVGLTAGLDFTKTETLGLQLVNMLTKQLRGRIELSGEHGTLWAISFRTMDNAKSGSP
jgi:PAS domain S-box-containing protein